MFESLRETENSEFVSSLLWFVPLGKMSECHGVLYIPLNSVFHVIAICDVSHVSGVTKKRR